MNDFFFRASSHIKTVLAHKKLVFNLAKKAGIPFQGITHDLSKFSPTELLESIHYYTDGTQSPILACKKEKGYSNAWNHHIKHNKHHLEYWVDTKEPYGAKLMPYNYWVELLCDTLAAGMNYKKDTWTKEYQLSYWENAITKWKSKENHFIHPATEHATERVYKEVAEKGIEPVITGPNLKKIYIEERIKIIKVIKGV